MTESWPVAELDAVARLRVVARSRSGGLFAERLLPVPMDVVWPLVADLEHTLPHLLPDVTAFRVTSTHGDRLQALVRGRAGVRGRFEVALSTGWCLMQGRFVLGGMAAVPDGDNTRFAFLGSFRLPGARLLRPLLGPVLDPLGDRYAATVLDRLSALVEPT
jgi:hypothetical protein